MDTPLMALLMLFRATKKSHPVKYLSFVCKLFFCYLFVFKYLSFVCLVAC
jgi:hypothetical protein